jgi:hypothetical protein
MTKLFLLLSALALVGAPSTPAAAEAPATPPKVDASGLEKHPATNAERARRNWRTYGAPILVMDVVTVASLTTIPLAGGLDALDRPAMAVPMAVGVLGLLSYPVRGPLIHLGHDNRSGAWRSLGVRLGAPTAGLYAGMLVGSRYGSSDGDSGALGGAVKGAAWGTLAGMMAGGMIDTWMFAAPPRPVLAGDPQPRGVTIAPTADIGDDGFRLGLTGRF